MRYTGCGLVAGGYLEWATGGRVSADQLLQYVTQGLYVLVFVVVLVETIRRPWRANIDIALFFGAISLVVAQQILDDVLTGLDNPLLHSFMAALVMALPYLLLRLVDDFADVPGWLMRVAEVGLVASVIALFVFPAPLPVAVVLPLVVYFFALTSYSAVAFARFGHLAAGVTRRRMYAASIASAALGLTILLSGVVAAANAGGAEVAANLATIMSRLLSLTSAIGYVFAFAPPTALRRAWQEPEVRAFLTRAADLPRLPDTISMIRELERGTASALGSPNASIVLWDEERRVLYSPVFEHANHASYSVAPGEMIAGQAFGRQEAIFSSDASRDDPQHRDVYEEFQARAVLAAPITAGDKRLGVLVAYAPRAPIFAADDLGLLRLLADQAAIILESRALIDEATRLRAREEANRLKDDFLSAAAHDLKTPLTTLVAQSQLLEKRARLDPQAPPSLDGIRRLVTESKRLNELVLELLDASRTEQGRLLGIRSMFNLSDLVRDICARERSDRHHCRVEIVDEVTDEFDRARIAQLIENLLENAVKYSPNGGDIQVRVWTEGDEVHLTVTDSGIGIGKDDLGRIFERFQRGGNVDDRQFAGMGLGLFICRGIAEEHGGRIWAVSSHDSGSTFHVVLPLRRTGVPTA